MISLGLLVKEASLTDEVIESKKFASKLVRPLHDNPYSRPDACIDELLYRVSIRTVVEVGPRIVAHLRAGLEWPW